MSYASEILSDSPALYARLDQVGLDSSGDTWPDLSGNSLDLTQVYDPSGNSPYPPARGFSSPIETDSGSTSFEGWSPIRFISGTPYSYLHRATDSLIEPAGEFAIEAWVMPLGNLGGTFPLVAKSSSIGIQCKQVSANMRVAGIVHDNAGTLFSAVDASFDLQDFIGTWFYVVVQRVGNTLALYVNSTLRATTSISSGLPTQPGDIGAGTDFQVGGFGLGGPYFRFDEAAFYTASLAEARIIAHWNAARFAVDLHGASDGHSTATLSSESARPRIEFPFQHNLNVDIRETLEYLTPTITSFDVTEQRMSNRTNPRRTLEYVVSPSGDGTIRRLLHSTLFKGQVGPYRLPIFADGSVVTNISIGDTAFSISTDGKDYDIGGELRIWKDESTFEYCAISDVQPTTVTISPGTGGAYSRAIIEPVRRSYLNGDGDIESVQTSIENCRMMFDVDIREVSSNRFAAFTPSLTYNDLEVFNLYQTRLDFQQTEQQLLHRFEDRFDYKNGSIATISRIETDSFVLPLTLTITDRARLGELLGWFQYRQGLRVPLWVPSFQRDFKVTEKPTSSGDTTFKIQYMEYSANYSQNEARQDIAFIKSDGTIICRRVTLSVDNLDGTETLTINSGLSGEYNTDFDRVSFLYPARLDHDRLELVYKNWSRGGAVEVVIRFVTLAHAP